MGDTSALDELTRKYNEKVIQLHSHCTVLCISRQLFLILLMPQINEAVRLEQQLAAAREAHSGELGKYVSYHTRLPYRAWCASVLFPGLFDLGEDIAIADGILQGNQERHAAWFVN